MTLGPIMLDLRGLTLDAEERELLRHPRVGGVILFSRNYENRAQLKRLVTDIHQLRSPNLLVAVDHEGGRVQRFRDEFTALPACRFYGDVYDQDKKRARRLARHAGWLMAAELRSVGVDFSFAPVLDVDAGVSDVIDDRAFHRHPQAVADLAHAWMSGMKQAGMSATGKHFPGHGSVKADSHVDFPVDDRPLADIRAFDLVAFERAVHYGLAAMMPAHVIYPQVDDRPAGFSRIWLQEILRGDLDFRGVIFSDDLSMAAASAGGDIVERAALAVEAGCDMVLVCNDREAAVKLVDQFDAEVQLASAARLVRMHGHGGHHWEQLERMPEWQLARSALNPEFHLV